VFELDNLSGMLRCSFVWRLGLIISTPRRPRPGRPCSLFKNSEDRLLEEPAKGARLLFLFLFFGYVDGRKQLLDDLLVQFRGILLLVVLFRR